MELPICSGTSNRPGRLGYPKRAEQGRSDHVTSIVFGPLPGLLAPARPSPSATGEGGIA